MADIDKLQAEYRAKLPGGSCPDCECQNQCGSYVLFCPLHASAPQLKALNKQLGEALEEQWKLNHVEYCGWDLPCAREPQCLMPMPDALAAAKQTSDTHTGPHNA